MSSPNPLPPKKSTELAPSSGKTPSSLTRSLRSGTNWAAAALTTGGIANLFISGLAVPTYTLFTLGIFLLILNRIFFPKSALIPLDRAEEINIQETHRFIQKCRYLEHVGDLGEKLADQLAQISERFKAFQSLLAQKFRPTELTFARYEAVARQTYLSLLDHLKFAATILIHLNAMDAKYIEENQGLAGPPASDSETESAAHPLKERKKLYGQQVEALEKLLLFHEKAITEFDRLGSALAEIKTKKSEATLHLESILTELNQLAERAKQYSIPDSLQPGLPLTNVDFDTEARQTRKPY